MSDQYDWGNLREKWIIHRPTLSHAWGKYQFSYMCTRRRCIVNIPYMEWKESYYYMNSCQGELFK